MSKVVTELPCVLAVSELVLTELSPAEVPLVAALGPQLLTAPRRRRRRDGALGMGVDEFTWTLAVLPVASSTVTWLCDQAKEYATEEIGQGARKALDWLRGRRAETKDGDDTDPPELSPALAASLRRVIQENGLAAGLDEEKARLIANATVGAFGAPREPA